MDVLEILAIVMIGIIIGGFGYSKLVKYSNEVDEKLKKEKVKSLFLNIYREISNDNCKYKNRTMNTVYITTEIEKKGEVDLVYLMDKNDVAILKDNNVIQTSNDMDTKTKISLINLVNEKFEKEIKDTIDIFGITFYKKNFEKALGVEIKDFNDLISKMAINSKMSIDDVDDIKKTNNSKFDINEILDKINESGISSLTQDERDFLKKESGKK